MAVSDEVHARFVANAKASVVAVRTVAVWLRRLGFQVEFGPQRPFGPSHADWRDRRDQGDLFILDPDTGTRQRVEVKHRQVRFTRAADFPYDTMIVCAKHAWDEANPKPSWVLCLNSQSTAVAAIDASSPQHWTVEEKFDKRYHEGDQLYSQAFYLVDKTRAHYLSLKESHDAESLRILARQVHQRGFAGIRGEDESGEDFQRQASQRRPTRDGERPQVDERARRQRELDECARIFGPPRDR